MRKPRKFEEIELEKSKQNSPSKNYLDPKSFGKKLAAHFKRKQAEKEANMNTKEGLCSLIVKSILKKTMEVYLDQCKCQVFCTANQTTQKWMIEDLKTYLNCKVFEGVKNIDRDIILQYKQELDYLRIKYFNK